MSKYYSIFLLASDEIIRVGAMENVSVSGNMNLLFAWDVKNYTACRPMQAIMSLESQCEKL